MKVTIKYPKTKCAYCGKTYTKKHNRQKYCSKTCSKNAKREQDRKAWIRWFHKNKKTLYQTRLGTRTIGPKPNPNPEREAEIIKNEKQRTLHQHSNFFDFNMKV
jgi:predicted nucleic acid-binding Zn ribbon protein